MARYQGASLLSLGQGRAQSSSLSLRSFHCFLHPPPLPFQPADLIFQAADCRFLRCKIPAAKSNFEVQLSHLFSNMQDWHVRSLLLWAVGMIGIDPLWDILWTGAFLIHDQEA